MARNIPFEFIIEHLMPADPVVRPFFGGYAVYIGPKIIFMLRDKRTNTDCNGVWIATTHEHHKSLKKELSIMCSVAVLNDRRKDKETGWQMLKAEDENFEPMAAKACDLVLRGDPRIGKVPKPKKKKEKP